PFANYQTIANGEISSEEEQKEDHVGAIIGFHTSKGEKVQAKVASSFISFDQAELNLKEVVSSDFEKVKEEGRKEWNDILGRVEIMDEDIDKVRTFYSALYRSVLFPRDFSEINEKGERVHYSPYNGKVLPGAMFTDTGFWDTFRSLFPLLNLVYPSMNDQMQEGLVNAYLESGFLPEWASPGHRASMIGNNSASVVADAFISGRKGYDASTLWEAVEHGANNVHPDNTSTGRFGYELYNELGYIPTGEGVQQNVARTLEYAYADWCIYQFGKSLGIAEDDVQVYKERAYNYKNLFDPSSNL